MSTSTPTTEHTGHRLYWTAIHADEAYSTAIHAVTGGKRNRWALTADEANLPSIKTAFDAKRRADAAWSAYQRWAK